MNRKISKLIRRTVARRRDLGRALLGLGLLCAACARIRPLEGGPPDREPPRLLQVSPADSTRRLTGKPVFELTWSERVDAASLRSSIRFQPPLRIAGIETRGRRTRVLLADSLPPETTVVLIVGRGLRDAVPRNNAIPAEIVLSYSTGSDFHAASIFGRVTVQGRVDPRAAVIWQPVRADSSAPRRTRLPAAAVDGNGAFHLAGLPAGVTGRLIGFIDRNGSLQLDEDELAVAYPESLTLEPRAVRRDLDWNIVNPREPALLRGVVQNRSGIRGPVAIAFHAGRDSAGADSVAQRGDAAALRASRATSAYAAAYDSIEALDPPGTERRAWVLVYASPRGDYSVKVPPGRRAWVAFVDAQRDSVPGSYAVTEGQGRAWEPLLWANHVVIEPGETLRLRTLAIEASRDTSAGRN